MSTSQTFRQELPPPGGYKPIHFERIPAKTYLNSFFMFGGLCVCVFGGSYIWSLNNRRNRLFETEMRSARFALMPLITAEKDREYLKQLRKNRDEEERLMANVPGWVVGTLFGDHIYKSRPKDEWLDVTFQEFYAHSSYKDINKYRNTPKYH